VPSDRPAPASLKTPPPIPPPVAAEKPGLKTIRIERRSDKPKAGPPETVIVQEHTDPAIFRQSDSLVSKVAHWVWDDPSKRGFRVGLPAGIFVFLAVFFAASGRGGKAQRYSPPKTVVTEVAEETRDSTPKAFAQEEPRGVDPSTLPPADDESGPTDGLDEKKSKARRGSHPSAPAETRIAAVDPPTPAPQAPAAPTPKPAEEPAPAARAPKPAGDDDIESPYAKAPKASAPAAPKPAAKPKKSAAADCSNPFTVDAEGIKRIRPECL
jgi:hypothetical protein